MSTYLSLTNELLRRVGEVIMDSTDFNNARNVQALAKIAINSSIRELMHSAQEWPFALTTQTQTLSTDGTSTYTFPSDFSSVDWESFYLKQLSSANNQPKRLPVLTYTQYLDERRPMEDQTGTGGYGAPEAVYQTQDGLFGITPKSDNAYQIEYKYWKFPDDLVNADDVCIVPSRFSSVIIDGAMIYMMLYRSNEQGAAIHRDKFESDIKMMRRLLMDEPFTVRSTMITPALVSPRVL
jgi:hypothetical protein